MAFAIFFKSIALIAFLTLNVKAATPDDVRRLRVEPLGDHAEHPSTRELQSKNGIVKFIKWAVSEGNKQPLIDKVIENEKKIKFYVTTNNK
ncbi:hypothetical protein GQ600_23926 [Phytophthora cactorum]|nr:hypothetical protein GQ600_23926 [Phytophthora cactorum]